MKNFIDRLDEVVGNGLEVSVMAHHRRRLARIGWQRALDPGPGIWAEGDPPPREGNSIEVFIDGEESVGALLESLGKARSSVLFAGWHLEPSFGLVRGDRPTIVRDFFAELAERVVVRILIWGGAPLPPLFDPSRGQIRELAETLSEGTKVRIGLDTNERPLHCHHEKIAVIDDEIAFVGGLDLTDLGGDRLDRSAHPPRGAIGWHDATTRIKGPLVADVGDHFRTRWRQVTGEALPSVPPPAPAGDVQAQIVRTVPEKRYDAIPKGDFRILEAYNRAFASARKLIYLENQFLWSPTIVRRLAEKLRNPPSDDFRILVVLPSKPTTGADDTRGQLVLLAEADDGAGRFLACALYARSEHHADPVYVHAKIGIVDDRWITIGSANLNNHSLFNDSEVNVVTCNEELARETRLRLWSEHLEVPVEDLRRDPTTVFDELWRPTAYEQRDRRDRGLNLTHRVVRLPHVSKRSKRLTGPLESLFVDG